MRRTVLLCMAGMLTGCQAEKPVVPIDPALTLEVYDAELVELKRLLTVASGSGTRTPWHQRMYLNPRILLPIADSATPRRHDQAWLESVVARGLVAGVCGHAPEPRCPDSMPFAFVSLGVPWTRNGDTVFVGGGYLGEVPDQENVEGTFWLFRVAETDSGLRVVGKGAPNTMTF